MHTQLPFFALIQVSGDDRHTFLHNQLSNDINHLQTNQACYATYNTPKGRVIANMIVYNTGTDILLAVAADLAEILLKRLKMFVLRAKVQLTILPDWGVSGSLKDNMAIVYPNEPHLVLPCNAQNEIFLPHGGSLKIAPKNELPVYDAAAESAWNTHEIACGFPWICAATTETCVAQMLNQHTIGGVHFRKGCYPGQEIIARAQYRGQVKRGLAVAHNQINQTVGAPVLDTSGAEVGLVINAQGSLNLLVIKHGMAKAKLYDSSENPFELKHLFFDLNDGA
ncbi:YgfZ/GcvT domain-containing protein [Wielerella bovis]|uniref:CAF17-like 4Fe-4S cluster assembly/insertion protein YgfZ n=1 Tax=Wielerella bovis TaxID=2917790 RepID=UPI0020194007|nr:folate-binding protein [Wielerella bovis]ULJ65342.1 folate-binding protein [Wielerella bovis]ULJ67689.1 folate-binding protein [Wielerella bovis]